MLVSDDAEGVVDVAAGALGGSGGAPQPIVKHAVTEKADSVLEKVISNRRDLVGFTDLAESIFVWQWRL